MSGEALFEADAARGVPKGTDRKKAAAVELMNDEKLRIKKLKDKV